MMDSGFARDSLKVLLDRLGDVGDPRVPAKVKFPLDEVFFSSPARQSPVATIMTRSRNGLRITSIS
jgi:hypothetical protein